VFGWLSNHAAGRYAAHVARRGSQTLPPQFAAFFVCTATGSFSRAPQQAKSWAAVCSPHLRRALSCGGSDSGDSQTRRSSFWNHLYKISSDIALYGISLL